MTREVHCVSDSDTTKQGYLQQELMENEALLEQSGQQEPGYLATYNSRSGPGHRAVVLLSETA